MYLTKSEKYLLSYYGISNNKKNEIKIKRILKLFKPQLENKKEKFENGLINYKTNKKRS